MAHSPEIPTRYVCERCQGVYAGTATREGGNYRYEPPDECAACGSELFVEMAQWVHTDVSNPEA